MDFTLTRGKDFSEFFDFKNEQGRAIPVPQGDIRIVLERSPFAREYTMKSGLGRLRNRVTWKIKKEETANFEYTTMYYTLYINDVDIVRGIVKVV